MWWRQLIIIFIFIARNIKFQVKIDSKIIPSSRLLTSYHKSFPCFARCSSSIWSTPSALGNTLRPTDAFKIPATSTTTPHLWNTMLTVGKPCPCPNTFPIVRFAAICERSTCTTFCPLCYHISSSFEDL